MQLYFWKHKEFATYKPSSEHILKPINYHVGDEFSVVENDMKLKDLEMLTEAKLAQKRNENLVMIHEYMETHAKDVQKFTN